MFIIITSEEERSLKGFAYWLVRHRTAVIILCLLLLIPSIMGMAATRTKYDLLYYLPQDLETVRGQEILLQDFGKGAFALLVTDGMNPLQQSELEESIRSIPHVDTVLGYASITKGMLPAEILPEKVRSVFQKDGCALTAVFFDTSSSAEETMEAIKAIRSLAGEMCFVSGLSAVVTDTKQLVEDQEATYVAIAVALCTVVLMITMDSFLLPIIFLVCIAVAVLWNFGSNYFFGEISYITKAVAAVLQLGVTLDYSIFLWHSYREQKTLTDDRDEAMAAAIGLTFSSIVGSSLTTIAGFVSICFMSFTLGRDLGIVMSKVMPKDLPSVIANVKLEENFNTATTHLLLVDADVSQKDVCDMTAEMEKVDGVKNVVGIDSLLGAGIPESILPKELVSSVKGERYQLMLINNTYVISSDEVNAQIDELNTILKKYDRGGMLIGEAPCTKDLIACTDKDFRVVTLISMIAIFVIIMIVEKSVSLPVLLVAAIELAIAANLCIPYFTHHELPFVGPILISTIQLGATVDYAILMTTRYKQNRLAGKDRTLAIQDSVASAAQSVLVSGMGFFAATYGVGLYSDIDIISSMCRLIARGALWSVAVVLFLLPAALLLLDKVIVHTTFDMKAAR